MFRGCEAVYACDTPVCDKPTDATTMHFRPHETLFFGDNLFNIHPIGFKFSHSTFQLKRQFSLIWSLNKISIVRVLVVAS